MAEISPFKAVHFGNQYSKELNRLITPPYDIISPEEQEAFYEAHPFNIIRLVLGKIYPEDTAQDNRYTRAAAGLKQWLAGGILKRLDKPSFTVYRMNFLQPDGTEGSIDGIVALVKLDEYGNKKVLPHEKTYKGPKEDQLALLRACRSNLTPIHALFDDVADDVSDQYKSLMEKPPEQLTKEANGTVHMTWTLEDEQAISKIVEVIKDKSLFIADGHHRYETSLAYKKEVEASGNATGDDHKWIMMYLTSMSHPGLTILPAHRMVKGLPDLDVAKVEDSLSPYFEMEELAFSDNTRDEVSRKLIERIKSYSNVGGKFGMVVQGEQCFRLLRIKDFKTVDGIMDPDIPSTLRGLDVTILREVIMHLGLGVDKDNSEGHIEYTPLVNEALNKVLQGRIQVSFILNPTRVDQMRAAAELGHKLPHKSTYFFPKISSGMVLNVFESV